MHLGAICSETRVNISWAVFPRYVNREDSQTRGNEDWAKKSPPSMDRSKERLIASMAMPDKGILDEAFKNPKKITAGPCNAVSAQMLMNGKEIGLGISIRNIRVISFPFVLVYLRDTELQPTPLLCYRKGSPKLTIIGQMRRIAIRKVQSVASDIVHGGKPTQDIHRASAKTSPKSVSRHKQAPHPSSAQINM